MILVVGQNIAWQKVCFLNRLSRGEVNRVDEVRAFPSSKGPNVVRALASMGKKGIALGYAGGRTGELFTEGMRSEGLAMHLTPIRAETRICTTFAEQDGLSTEVIEPSPEITPAERDLFRRIFGEHIDEASMLFICGTAVGGESEDCYAELTAEAHGRGVPVLMDSFCPQARRAFFEGPEVLKVNVRELAEIAGHPTDGPAARLEVYKRLSATHGIRWFFTTMGDKGMEGFDGHRLLHASPPAVKAVNTIGSGDAASAGIGWMLEKEISSSNREAAFTSAACFARALLTGTAMGTANCMNPLNGKVEREDFLAVKEEVSIREVAVP